MPCSHTCGAFARLRISPPVPAVLCPSWRLVLSSVCARRLRTCIKQREWGEGGVAGDSKTGSWCGVRTWVRVCCTSSASLTAPPSPLSAAPVTSPPPHRGLLNINLHRSGIRLRRVGEHQLVPRRQVRCVRGLSRPSPPPPTLPAPAGAGCCLVRAARHPPPPGPCARCACSTRWRLPCSPPFAPLLLLCASVFVGACFCVCHDRYRVASATSRVEHVHACRLGSARQCRLPPSSERSCDGLRAPVWRRPRYCTPTEPASPSPHEYTCCCCQCGGGDAHRPRPPHRRPHRGGSQRIQ